MGDRCVAAGHLSPRSRSRSRKRSSGARTPPILVFDDATGGPIDLDLRGIDRRRAGAIAATLTPPSRRKTTADAGAARSRPAETRRGRARGDAVAAALGMAGAAIGRRFGRAAPAGRRGAARQQDKDRISAGAGSGLSFHVGDGRRTSRITRKWRARCSRTTPSASRPGRRPGPPTCATTPAGSPRRAFEQQAAPAQRCRLIARM